MKPLPKGRCALSSCSPPCNANAIVSQSTSGYHTLVGLPSTFTGKVNKYFFLRQGGRWKTLFWCWQLWGRLTEAARAESYDLG